MAALRGWEWVASPADVATITLAEWYANVHRDPKGSKDPFRFPRPWPDETSNADVTADQRAELEAQLMQRSALRDR